MSTTAPENTGATEPNGTEGTEPNPEPTLEDLQKQIEDLKTHSRKWEQRAKENKTAAERLAELERANLSAEEQTARTLQEAQERAEKAERDALRFRIAAKFQISDEDADLFLTASDEDTMTRQAQRFSERATSSTGVRPNPAQGKRSGSAPTSTAEQFAAAIEDLF